MFLRTQNINVPSYAVPNMIEIEPSFAYFACGSSRKLQKTQCILTGSATAKTITTQGRTCLYTENLSATTNVTTTVHCAT